MSEGAKQSKGNFWKLLLTILIFRGAVEVVRLFLPELFAVWLTALAVSLISYWIPPKPNMSYWKWVINSWQAAALIFMIVTAYVLIGDWLTGFFKTN